MRDFLAKNKRYFEEFIESHNGLIEDSIDILEDQEIEERNLIDVNHQIFIYSLEILVASDFNTIKGVDIKIKYLGE